MYLMKNNKRKNLPLKIEFKGLIGQRRERYGFLGLDAINLACSNSASISLIVGRLALRSFGKLSTSFVS
jgi:hypothetical protein